MGHDIRNIGYHVSFIVVTVPKPQSVHGSSQGRLRESEVTRRLLDAASELVERDGLFSGLAEVSFEEAIALAGVPRSSAYRRWPTRQAFTAAVTLEIARGTRLQSGWAQAGLTLIRDLNPDELLDPRRRHDLWVDAIRQLIHLDFIEMLGSKQMRLFASLTATQHNLADEQLRTRVRATLAETEQRYVTERAENLAWLGDLAGMRLRAPLGGPEGWRLVSAAAGATMTGQLLKAWVDPAPAAREFSARAFGMSQPASWTQQTYLGTATLLAYLEPDPAVEWTLARAEQLLTRIRETLSAL